MFLIEGNYGLGNTAYVHYFWVHTNTRVGELAELWYKAEFGGIWEQSSDNLPALPPTWFFQGQPMRWVDTLGQIGMTDGSRFRILNPDPNRSGYRGF
jgi:hypothetical protein